jgi:hypothetical protein
VLQGPQQLGLDAGRHFPDLVQEERAAVRHAEESGRPHGPGEGPLLVAEQLALDDRLRKRPAIHGNEFAVRTRARGVNGPGNELLAGPALAGDQHVALVATKAVDRARQRAHLRRVSHELRGRRAHLQLLFELPVATDQAPALDRLAHRGPDAVHVVERLGQVVEGTAPDAAHGAFDAGVPGHHDHLHLGPLALPALQQLEPTGTTEEQVQKHDVEVRIGEGGRRRLR